MAILGRWTGSNISLTPTESWAAPNGMFPTQARNDSSAYSFTSSTSTLTLPSSGLADGYLIVGAYEYENSGSGRLSLQGRITQASGTGTFVGSPTGGYSRGSDDNHQYIRCWAFIDNPSASATFQFEFKRDFENAGASAKVVRSELIVIPFYYSDIGLYSSTSAALYGGTTPTVVTGWTGTDGTNITRSGNVITLAGDNKRYLLLGEQYFEGYNDTRTQRWGGFRINSAQEDAAKGYWYSRFAAEDETGNLYTWLLETATSNVTVETTCYRGDGTAAGQGGGTNDGSIPTLGSHSLVAIELHESAEVFQSVDETGEQQLALTGPVDLNVFRSTDINFSDSGSWSRVSDTAMEAQKSMDALLGANVSAANKNVSTGTRWTAKSEFTANGTEQADTFHGNFMRGTDTHGWSANPLSFVALTSTQDVGLSVTELPTSLGGGGDVTSPAGWVGIWGINLDTLEGGVSGSVTATETADTLSATGSLEIQATVTATEAADTLTATGSLEITGSVTATEQPDNLTATGSLEITAEVTATEQADKLNAVGAFGLVGSVTATEAADTLAATGQLSDPPTVQSKGGGFVDARKREREKRERERDEQAWEQQLEDIVERAFNKVSAKKVVSPEAEKIVTRSERKSIVRMVSNSEELQGLSVQLSQIEELVKQYERQVLAERAEQEAIALLLMVV